MENFQEFFFQEATLLLAIFGGLGGLIFYMVSKKIASIDENILKIESDLKKEIKEIEKHQREYEKASDLTHKELYELTKKIEIQYSKLEAKIDLIGRKVCNGAWK